MPLSKIKTNSISNPVALTAPVIDGAGYSPFGFKNFIINGAFQHWQRGTSFAYNFGGAYFNADRFWVYNNTSASSGNIERSTDVPSAQGFTYSLFNNTNGSHACGTNVELTRQGNPAPFKVGQSYTLSMWVKGTSNSSSNLQITWRNSHANGTDTVYIDLTKTIPYTTTWTRVTVTFVITDNIGANNLVLDLEWNLPAGGKITGVQLEEGSVATSFEHRPVQTELALCQRYYEVVTYPSLGIMAQYTGSQFYSGATRFVVTKRAAPTLSISAGSSYWVCAGQFAVSAYTSHTFGTFNATTQGFGISSNRPAGNNGPTSGGCYLWEGDATITASAEL